MAHKKTSQTFCLRKDTCSKPRQNCFGNWIEHCLHHTCHTSDVTQDVDQWEILDEVGTLVKISLSRTVAFHESGCTIRDPDSRRSFLDWKKLIYFSLIHRKQKLTNHLLKTSLLPECRRLYPGNDFVVIQDSVTSHRGNDATVSTTAEHCRLHSCCWWVSIVFSRS